MLRALLDFFISIVDCPHSHTTSVRTVKDRSGRAARPVSHYVACLDCGRALRCVWPPEDGVGGSGEPRAISVVTLDS